MAELKQALLGRLAGGVDGVNAAATTTGAAQDIDAEGVLMKGCSLLVHSQTFPAMSARPVRLLPLDRDPVEVKERVRASPVTFDTVAARRRLRRYVQIQGSERAFFKSFGDPRVISRNAGAAFHDIATLKRADPTDGPATELLHFAIHSLPAFPGPTPKSSAGAPRSRSVAATRPRCSRSSSACAPASTSSRTAPSSTTPTAGFPSSCSRTARGTTRCQAHGVAHRAVAPTSAYCRSPNSEVARRLRQRSGMHRRCARGGADSAALGCCRGAPGKTSRSLLARSFPAEFEAHR
jgi:hypothetical protein